LVLHTIWFGGTVISLSGDPWPGLIILGCLALSLRFIWGLTSSERTSGQRLPFVLGELAAAVVGCAAAGRHMELYQLWPVFAGVMPLLVLAGFWAALLSTVALAAMIAEVILFLPGGREPATILHYVLEFALIWGLVRAGLFQLRQRRAEATYLERAHESTTLLAQANLRLQEYAEEVRQLAAVEERNRLARDIHDTLGHSLTSIIMQLSGTLELLDNPREVRAHIETVREVARTGLQEVRFSVKELRAPAVDRPRGRELWTRVASTFAETTGVEIFAKIDEEFDDLDETTNELVYRAIQEGLTNAVRHGHAEQVEIAIRWENGTLLVRISDNGHGVKDIQQGFGLQGLRERTETIHGRIFCRSAPGWGFDLGLEIPWPRGGQR